MPKKTYSDKLKDPRWQRMRLEIMQYAGFRCQICGRKDQPLHVHHSYYTKGKNPWQYPPGSLICVCEDHHKMIHSKPEPAQSPAAEPEPVYEAPQVEHVPASAEVAKSHFQIMREALLRGHR